MTNILTEQELDADPLAALRLDATRPVIVTRDGRPAYALLSIDDYRMLVGDTQFTPTD